MNGYALLAESCRNMADTGYTNGQELRRKAELYEFLATCNDDDFYTLFDSTAFNEIAKGYLHRALSDLQNDETITSEQAEAIRARYAGVFDEMQARQVVS